MRVALIVFLMLQVKAKQLGLVGSGYGWVGRLKCGWLVGGLVRLVCGVASRLFGEHGGARSSTVVAGRCHCQLAGWFGGGAAWVREE